MNVAQLRGGSLLPFSFQVGHLPGNPVRQVDKPSQRREREPVLVTVEQVERCGRGFWHATTAARRS